MLCRGSTGEIVDEHLLRLIEQDVVVESDVLRRDLGTHRDFEDRELVQISLDGGVLWRNAFLGRRLSDEELAIADLLEATGRWSVGEGPSPYPLEAAAQDQLIGLAIDRAATTGGLSGPGQARGADDPLRTDRSANARQLPPPSD